MDINEAMEAADVANELELENQALKDEIKELRLQLTRTRKKSIDDFAKFEREEEQMCNKLIRSIDVLRQEKAQLVNHYEEEEEFITNQFLNKKDDESTPKIERRRRSLPSALHVNESEISRLHARIAFLENTYIKEVSKLRSELEELRDSKK